MVSVCETVPYIVFELILMKTLNLAHKEMRSINFPFPYEDNSRAAMGVKC